MKLRAGLLLTACLLLLLAAVLVGPSLGGSEGSFIVWQLRVPRVLVGVLVGGTLALVGAVFQALFQNPLATSDTVGTTEFDKLPEKARQYVEFLSAQIGVEIGLISTGPERDQTVILQNSVMEGWFK